MTYDRTRDRSRHTEYSRPQHTSRRNENRETRDMSKTRHRYNRTRSPRNEYRQTRDVSESRNRYNQTYEHNYIRSARGAINYYEPQQQNFMTNQMHQGNNSSTLHHTKMHLQVPRTHITSNNSNRCRIIYV